MTRWLEERSPLRAEPAFVNYTCARERVLDARAGCHSSRVSSERVLGGGAAAFEYMLTRRRRHRGASAHALDYRPARMTTVPEDARDRSSLRS